MKEDKENQPTNFYIQTWTRDGIPQSISDEMVDYAKDSFKVMYELNSKATDLKIPIEFIPVIKEIPIDREDEEKGCILTREQILFTSFLLRDLRLASNTYPNLPY